MSHINDEQGAVVLQAAGFEQNYHPEFWEDVGGPENGPYVVGHQEHCMWCRRVGDTDVYLYVVAFADGHMEAGEDWWPADWEPEEWQ